MPTCNTQTTNRNTRTNISSRSSNFVRIASPAPAKDPGGDIGEGNLDRHTFYFEESGGSAPSIVVDTRHNMTPHLPLVTQVSPSVRTMQAFKSSHQSYSSDTTEGGIDSISGEPRRGGKSWEYTQSGS